MRFFISDKPTTAPMQPAGFRGKARRRDTPQYVEFEEALDPGSIPNVPEAYMVYYAQPHADRILICACLLNLFDWIEDPAQRWRQQLPDEAAQAGLTAWSLGIAKAFPIFNSLYNNGITGNFNPAGLGRSADPDDLVKKWFVGAYVGNVRPSNPLQFPPPGDEERTWQVTENVLNAGANLVLEAMTREFDYAAFREFTDSWANEKLFDDAAELAAKIPVGLVLKLIGL